jgi:hypothetical protein
VILDAERFDRKKRFLQEWLVFKKGGDMCNQEEAVGAITGLSGPVGISGASSLTVTVWEYE